MNLKHASTTSSLYCQPLQYEGLEHSFLRDCVVRCMPWWLQPEVLDCRNTSLAILPEGPALSSPWYMDMA